MEGRGVPYLRVSSDEQHRSGAGIEAQRIDCRRAAEKLGLPLAPEFQELDGICGELPPERRPTLLSAIASLKKGDVLLVQKRDRLARDPMVIAMIEALVRSKKARVISAAGEGTECADPTDPFAFVQRSIADVFSRYELLMNRLRTRSSLRAKRLNGERNGRVPYGWDLVDNGKRSKIKINQETGERSGGLPIGLAENPQEQHYLRCMREWRAEGRSLAWITRKLNDLGSRTKAGKTWARSSVGYVLKVSIPLLKDPPSDGPAEAQGPARHVG